MDEKTATVSKERVLAEFRSGWAAWDALLAEIPTDRMTEPGATGAWTVKDVVAHLFWHERELVGVLRARALVGSDLWNVDTPTRNDAIYAELRDRPLAEVLADARRTHDELEAELERLTDDDLNDPARIRDMVPGIRPWQIVADNTYEHYRAHHADLNAWLNSTAGERAAGTAAPS